MVMPMQMVLGAMMEMVIVMDDVNALVMLTTGKPFSNTGNPLW